MRKFVDPIFTGKPKTSERLSATIELAHPDAGLLTVILFTRHVYEWRIRTAKVPRQRWKSAGNERGGTSAASSIKTRSIGIIVRGDRRGTRGGGISTGLFINFCRFAAARRRHFNCEWRPDWHRFCALLVITLRLFMPLWHFEISRIRNLMFRCQWSRWRSVFGASNLPVDEAICLFSRAFVKSSTL